MPLNWLARLGCHRSTGDCKVQAIRVSGEGGRPKLSGQWPNNFHAPDSLAGIDRVVQGEAYFEGDLIMGDFAVFDVASRFEDFEPAEMLQLFGGPFDRVLDGVFNAGGG